MKFFKQNSNSQEEYEEIREKKTSILGYILLFIMTIFVISIGEVIFRDLSRIPDRPRYPDSCISSVTSDYSLERLSRMPNCSFSDIDKKYGLDSKYNTLKSDLQKIVNYNSEINDYKINISTLNRENDKLERDYDLSLQEKIANENGIMNKTNIKNTIVSNNNSISKNNNYINQKTSQKNVVINQISSQVAALKINYVKAQDHYKFLYALYRLKIFLLNLLFIVPLFAFSIFYYFKNKKVNSPYTIIFTAVLTATSILFLQVILVFLYEILPKEWLGRVFDFMMDIPFFRYIVYYGSVILVILIFGGIVYYIQKKAFSSNVVAVRRLKDNKCPNCSFTLHHENNFCPKCGLQLKEACTHCQNAKNTHLPFCPVCGKR